MIARLSFPAIVFLCATGVAQAADTANANYQPPPPDSHGWLSNIAGAKFVAVDGSTITLTPTEGSLSLILLAPNGAAQKSTFAFMSDKLGTIADDSDLSHIIGFFRETDTGIEAQFADGRTESLVANTAGGISLTMHSSATDSNCTSWYPADHVFGAAEKRAALAAYADKLGISEHGKNAARATAAPCVPAMRAVKAKNRPSDTAPLLTISHPVPAAPSADPAVKGSGSLIPVVVHNSDVHLIDNAAAKSAAKPLSASQAAAPQLIQASLQQTASVAQPAVSLQTSVPAPVPTGSGASDCLSVETNGADVGFRNRCAYGVQFAYCLQKASDTSIACDAGSKAGAITANGFTAVLQDTGIKSAEADHDFRWVACSGNTNDVVVHLDHADPPAGRCVKTGAAS
jgi:hypothetical protein